MLLVSYMQQYFNTSITVLTNQVWKLLITLFKVPNTGAFTVRNKYQCWYNLAMYLDEYWCSIIRYTNYNLRSASANLLYRKWDDIGWSRKTERDSSHKYVHVDAITGISVLGNFSWEKYYQDQQFRFLCRLNECSWRHIAIQILYARACVRPFVR